MHKKNVEITGSAALNTAAIPTGEQMGADQMPGRQAEIEELLNANDVVCAHVYDDQGYSEFLLHGSPENIANFIGARPLAHQIVLTDREERPFLWTIGFFIDRCLDKGLLEQVKNVLIPIQMCERAVQPIFCPSIGEVVGYQLRQQMVGYKGAADE